MEGTWNTSASPKSPPKPCQSKIPQATNPSGGGRQDPRSFRLDIDLFDKGTHGTYIAQGLIDGKTQTGANELGHRRLTGGGLYYNIVITGGLMGAVRKLTKIGNSYGLILPRGVLEVVGIDPKKGCRVTIKGGRLSIEAAGRRQTPDEEVAHSMLRFMRKYRNDLARLAK